MLGALLELACDVVRGHTPVRLHARRSALDLTRGAAAVRQPSVPRPAQVRIPGRAREATATISDQQKRSEVMIEYRVVLPPSK